jgi:DNA-binding winged helix-turn-helix (wHTH) protein
MNSRERALTARFGRFLLDSHRRELLADGVPVPIGSRAFDVLIVLMEARGQLVTKDELLNRVWPRRFVEENCLQFHISALRKALAPDRDFIKTIPGRGYCFIADVSTHDGPDVVSVAPHDGSPLSTRLPAAMSGLIGQEVTSTGAPILSRRFNWLRGSMPMGSPRRIPARSRSCAYRRKSSRHGSPPRDSRHRESSPSRPSRPHFSSPKTGRLLPTASGRDLRRSVCSYCFQSNPLSPDARTVPREPRKRCRPELRGLVRSRRLPRARGKWRECRTARSFSKEFRALPMTSESLMRDA